MSPDGVNWYKAAHLYDECLTTYRARVQTLRGKDLKDLKADFRIVKEARERAAWEMRQAGHTLREIADVMGRSKALASILVIRHQRRIARRP